MTGYAGGKVDGGLGRLVGRRFPSAALHGSAVELQEYPDVKRAYLGEGA
ncbi:MAG: hypothetical protein ABSD47_05390 [Candidatus Methylomirabilota bacterium]|jgi:hypothetical protein